MSFSKADTASQISNRTAVRGAEASAGAGPEPARGGVVRALYLGRITGGPMERREQLRLLDGAGIEGDRYAGRGRLAPGDARPKGLALTLVEQEALEALRHELGIDLDFAVSRRNVVTSGVRLDALVGAYFRVGPALVRGVAANPPCSRLERLGGIAGLRRAMRGRGGIRADVLEGGLVSVGDAIAVLPGPQPPGDAPGPPLRGRPD